MTSSKRWVAVLGLPLIISGCSTTGDRPVNLCVLGGAVAGAAAGVAVGGEVIGGLVGAGAGAVMGEFHCGAGTSKKAMAMAKDSDGDGVNDDQDRCPGTRKGVRVNANGCPVDADGDGVPTHEDICPNTPKGVKVDANGCALDSDGDGVPTHLDICPNTPKGAKVDANGCSKPGETLAIVTNVNFDFDKATLRPDGKQRLTGIIDILKANPKLRVRIVGHTDSTGSEGYNLGLSLSRADSVRAYLAKNGISLSRLIAGGKGESQPLVPNTSRAGRAVNRRVEFEVISR